MSTPIPTDAPATTICTRCQSRIRWNGQKWTTLDSPIEPCLPGLGTEHRPADV